MRIGSSENFNWTVLIGLLIAMLIASTYAHSQGFPNVPQTAGELIGQQFGTELGRVTTLSWLQGRLVATTVSSGGRAGSTNVATHYNISDPRNPRGTAFGPGGATSPGGHGYWLSESANGAPALLGLPYDWRNPGEAWSFDTNGNIAQVAAMRAFPPIPNGYPWPGRGLLSSPFYAPFFWNYNNNNHLAQMWRGNELLAEWDHMAATGVTGHHILMGDRLYVLSDDENTGMAQYDVTPTLNSPGTPPRILGIYSGQVGGYWPVLWGTSDGTLKAIFPSRDDTGHYLIANISDPLNMYVECDRRALPGQNYWESDFMYATAQDNEMLIDRASIDMNTCAVVSLLNNVRHGISASQFALPLGNLVVVGGADFGSQMRQGIAVFARKAAPDTTGPTIGYHRPRPNQTNYPRRAQLAFLIHETLSDYSVFDQNNFTVRPIDSAGRAGAPVAGQRTLSSEQIFYFTPDAQLASDSTYEVTFAAGGFKDAAGNALARSYTFRFSTGNSVIGNGGSTPTPIPTATGTITPTPTPTTTPTWTPTPNHSITGTPTPTRTATPIATRTTTPTATPSRAATTTPTQAATPTFAGPGAVRIELDQFPIIRGSSVLISAVPSVPSARYRFSFGDGTSDVTSTSATVSHHYQSAGHFTTLVQVTSPTGNFIARRVVTVIDEEVRSASRSSGPITLDAREGISWVVNPDNDSVSKIVVGLPVVEYPLPAGCDPRSIAQDQNSLLWISCYDLDKVVILDPLGSIAGTIDLPYGSAPFGIVIGQNSAYMTLQGKGQLLRYNTSTRELNGMLALGASPRALALTSDESRLLITRFISPQERAEVWDVGVAPGQLILKNTIILERDVTSADTDTSGRGVLNYLSSIAIDPTGRWAYVAAKKDNTARGTYSSGLALTSENTVRAALAVIDLQFGIEARERRVDIDNADSPSAIAFSPLGDYLFLALQGNELAVVFDLLSNVPVQKLRILVGSAPQGIVVGHEYALVSNFLGRTVTILALRDFLDGNSGNIGTGTIAVVNREQLTPQVLAGKRIFYTASKGDESPQTSRMSSQGYISCASCHIDGSHDGRVWDFTNRGEGLRNTTDLRGRRGTGHGGLHWSRNFDEVQDFENDIRLAFGGRGFMSDADFLATRDPLGPPKSGLSQELDALAAYVTSLQDSTLPRSPYRSEQGALSASAEQGKLHFNALNCIQCHSGSSLTDSELHGVGRIHNVGTLTSASGQRLGLGLLGIDTPTLRGLWNTEPYLHAGQAKDLASIFFENGPTITYQAEEALLSGGAFAYRDASGVYGVHGGGAILTSVGQNAAAKFVNVDGGGGGAVIMKLRYSTTRTATIGLEVNGQAHVVTLGHIANDNNYPPFTRWEEHEVAITLMPGRTNSIEINWRGAEEPISFDDMSVVQIDSSLYEPHSRVRNLSNNGVTELIQFLLELDGSNVDLRTPIVPASPPSILMIRKAIEVVSSIRSYLRAKLLQKRRLHQKDMIAFLRYLRIQVAELNADLIWSKKQGSIQSVTLRKMRRNLASVKTILSKSQKMSSAAARDGFSKRALRSELLPIIASSLTSLQKHLRILL